MVMRTAPFWPGYSVGVVVLVVLMTGSTTMGLERSASSVISTSSSDGDAGLWSDVLKRRRIDPTRAMSVRMYAEWRGGSLPW
jgi:hypothetical protein